MKSIPILLFLLAVPFFAVATEKLAVAEPMGELQSAEKEALAALIETRLNDRFQTVSRVALKPILTEADFQQSGLVNPVDQYTDGTGLAGAKYLLVSSFQRSGEQYFLTMMVVDAATGKLLPGRRAAVAVSSPAMLPGRVDAALAAMGMLREESAGKLKTLALTPVQGQKGLMPEFHGMLSELLTDSGAFLMLARANIDQILFENKLSGSDFADADAALKAGRLLAADCLLIPTVMQARREAVISATAIAGGSRDQRVLLQFQLKVLNVTDGKILFDRQFRYVGKYSEIPAELRRDWTGSDYADYFIRKALGSAVATLVDEVSPLTVAAMAGDRAILGRGSRAGLGEGRSCRLYSRRTAGSRELLLPNGTAKILSVGPDSAIAEITGNSVQVQPGDVCRPLPGEETAAPVQIPAYPKATSGY